MVKKKSKNSDGLKAYIFKADPNSMEGKWLSTQANRTLSLKILIKKAVRQYGMVDVNSLAIDGFVTNPDTDLASEKDSKSVVKEDNSNGPSPNLSNRSHFDEDTKENNQNSTTKTNISENSQNSTDTDLKDSKIKTDNGKESQNYADKLKKILPPDMTEGVN